MPAGQNDLWLLLTALVAVGGLVLLVARWKLNAFIALILASLFVGVASGMPLKDVAKAFQDGVGAMLGSVAMVVGLGAVLGKLLGESGGADVVANKLVRLLGEDRLHWTLLLVGFVLGIPVFFTVGLVLLIPLVYTLARSTQKPLLLLGLPLISGLSVVHGLTPPHPGAMAAIGTLKADVGKVILYSLLLGLPAAVLAGPIFVRWCKPGLLIPEAGLPVAAGQSGGRAAKTPGFSLTLFTILLPILLMLGASACDVIFLPTDRIRIVADFVGHPLVSLTISVLFAFYSFGSRCGFGKSDLAKMVESSLGPVAAILLIVGAGGGFNRVLIQSGVGDVVAAFAKQSSLSPLILGWLVAAVIRIATGSATVAISTAAGLLLPVALKTPGINLELLVISMGAGSLILSHLNDGGFWFVKEYLHMSVPQTLKTWTVIETTISITVLLETLLLNSLIS